MTLLIKLFQLAEDWEPKKARFPVIVQPKYDGVRAGNLFGRLAARSPRQFDNKHATSFFSQAAFLGLDGEMAAGPEDAPDLCRATSSALSTITGTPWLMWHVFDYLRPETVALPYMARYLMLCDRIAYLQSAHPELACHLCIMPYEWCESRVRLDELIIQHADKRYEGTIVRDPNLPHKNGRSSPTHGGLLRIKPFIEVDALVTKIYEGQRNENELETSLTGHAKRSTHQENMVPNGMVGAMDAELLEDAIHPFTRELVLRKGENVRFSAGRMTHEERAHYFVNQHLLNGKRIKGQIFAHGTKDKARMPTFQSMRMDSDYIRK